MTNYSEKRSRSRIPIKLDAQLQLSNGQSWPCTIADYCTEGMFIRFDTEKTALVESYISVEHGSILGLGFSVPGQNKGRDIEPSHFSIEADIVHIIEGAVGVRFVREYPNEIRALQSIKVNKDNREQVREGKVNVSLAQSKEIISELVLATKQHAQPLMEGLGDILVEEVKAASLKSSSDQLSNAMMAAGDRVESENRNIQNKFVAELEDPIGLYNQRVDRGVNVSDSLSLVGKGEFEDWLTSRVITTKAETRYLADLLPLRVRLQSISVGSSEYDQSVFGPVLLVDAFHHSIVPLNLVNQAEKLIFQLFDQHVMSDLDALYKSLNDILKKHNVLPELDVGSAARTTRKPSRPNKPQDKQNPTAEVDKNINDLSSTELTGQQSTFTSAPPFSANHQDSRNGSSVDATNPSVLGMMRSVADKPLLGDLGAKESSSLVHFTDSELAEGLAKLQSAPSTLQENSDESSSLLDRVKQNLGLDGESEKEIDKDQKVAIDVVDRFFLSMRSNPRISNEAKQHLLKLEVPVLKVLLNDEGFFEDHSSSVRAVMNRIAQLGAKGSRLNPASKKKISRLVQQIVEEFEQDTKVFDHVLSELDKLIERQNQLYSKNVERVAAAADGVHRVEEAAVAVARALNKRFEDKQIPSAVISLVESGWKELLNRIFIEYGEDSEEWRTNLAIIDDLIEFGEDPDKSLNVKVILPKIQEGLKLVSGSSDGINRVRDQLKDLIQQGPKSAHEAGAASLHEVPETEEDIVRQNISKSHELKSWIIKAKNVQLGTWLQYKKDDADAQYMRLVWIAKGYSKYVFVNHQGMKVIELGLFKLASNLKGGSIVEEHDYEIPIVNQGLDDMVKDVYDKLSFESNHDEKSGLIKKSEFCRQVKLLMASGRKTSLCSLIYISFKQNGEKLKALDDTFSKKVADSLNELNEKTSVVGRISTSDFALFTLEEGMDMLLLRCQESMKVLCDSDEFSPLELEALIAESSAHLGFRNPESMIRTARLGLNKAASDKINQFEGEFPSEESETEGSQKSTADDSISIESHTEVLEKSFDDLSFEIYTQITKPTDESVHIEHINLICSVEGSGVVYEPENSDDSIALDNWWLQRLVQTFKNKDPILDGMEYVRVKLSFLAFENEEYKSSLLALCSSGDIDPKRICFDIYDCSLMAEVNDSADRMRQLVAKGFRFSLDHFGSARSPFGYLKVLPVKMISIDESYVETLNQPDGDEVAANSISEVAHYLGKKVLATSVDTAICLQKMKRLGADFVQGTTVSEASLLEL